MLTGERSGYWVVEWSEDWDPSLADLLSAIPELVLGKRVAIASCDSGLYRPTEQELANGWSVNDGVALSPVIKAVSELPIPGFDEWYVFESKPKAYPKRNFVNQYGFSPLHSDKDEVTLFWSQIEMTHPVHALGAGTPNMFLVTRDRDMFERGKMFNTSLDSAASRRSA